MKHYIKSKFLVSGSWSWFVALDYELRNGTVKNSTGTVGSTTLHSLMTLSIL